MIFEAVAAEKDHINFISGVEQFDKTTMKHAETSEKNPLPPLEGIYLCSICVVNNSPCKYMAVFKLECEISSKFGDFIEKAF
jgi:hypothetical protein